MAVPTQPNTSIVQAMPIVQKTPNEPSRLSLETHVALAEITDVIGECGHAVIWALNKRRNGGNLPSAPEIVKGIYADLSLVISLSSAERALRKIKAREGIKREGVKASSRH